jgi:hypothetical protein
VWGILCAIVVKYCIYVNAGICCISDNGGRAGLVTSAAKNGVPEYLIMRQTRHRQSGGLRKYIRMGTLFEENAAAKVGL